MPVFLSLFCRELDQFRHIVRLDFRLGGCLIAADRSAFGAFMGDDESLFRIRLRGDGLHLPAAIRCPIAGIFIQMEGPQTKRTMIAGGVAQGLYFLSAMGSDESAVVLCKSFRFHFVCPFVVNVFGFTMGRRKVTFYRNDPPWSLVPVPPQAEWCRLPTPRQTRGHSRLSCGVNFRYTVPIIPPPKQNCNRGA